MTASPNANGAADRPRKRSAAERTLPLPIEAWEMPEGLVGAAHLASDLIADAEEPPTFVVDRLAEDGDVVLVTGQEKIALKTWLALDLAIARILGREWLGFAVARERRKRVLIVSTETRGTVLVRRMLASCAGASADPEMVGSRIVILDEPVSMVPTSDRDRVRSKARLDASISAVRIHDGDRRAELLRAREQIADGQEAALGQNLDLLDAISVEDTWSLIIVDTLRQCLIGDENTSRDARAFVAAVRELARGCGCPVVIVHHTGKGGTAGDPRSARGSGELTAGPDALVTIDSSGEYPTASFLLRNHVSPEPVGYRLATEGEGVRLEILPPCAGSTGGMSTDDVLDIFRRYPSDGLTITTLRKLMGSPTSKANPKTMKKHVSVLLARGAISECEIERALSRQDRAFGAGKGGKTMQGYRLGTEGGRVPAAKIVDPETSMGDPSDV